MIGAGLPQPLGGEQICSSRGFLLSGSGSEGHLLTHNHPIHITGVGRGGVGWGGGEG